MKSISDLTWATARSLLFFLLQLYANYVCVQQQRDINLSLFLFLNRSHENPLFSLSAEHETVKSDWELRHGVASCGTIRGPSMICCALSRAAGRADPSQGFMTDSAPFFLFSPFDFWLPNRYDVECVSYWIINCCFSLSLFVCRFDRKDRSSSFRPFPQLMSTSQVGVAINRIK